MLFEVGSWLFLGLLLSGICSVLGTDRGSLLMALSAGVAGSIIGGCICRLSIRESRLLQHSLPPLVFAGAGAVVAALAIGR
jgi:hypothetical protein